MSLSGITTDVTKGYTTSMKAAPEHKKHLNDHGRELLKLIRRVRPNPVRITGTSGWGKSMLCRLIAEQTCVCGKCTGEKRNCAGQAFTVIAGQPGLRVEDIVGEWAPTAKKAQGEAPLAFKDGPLTLAAINGSMCFFEELARAPVETQSRLFDVLDDTGRSLNIAARDERVVVHEKFWLLSTENPAGSAGYFTQPMDVALMKRFWLHVEINEPIADELRVITGIFGNDVATAERAMNWVTDLRRNPVTMVSTRELVIFAKLIVRGLTPLEAAIGGVAPHYAEAASVIRTITEQHFAATA